MIWGLGRPSLMEVLRATTSHPLKCRDFFSQLRGVLHWISMKEIPRRACNFIPP